MDKNSEAETSHKFLEIIKDYKRTACRFKYETLIDLNREKRNQLNLNKFLLISDVWFL